MTLSPEAVQIINAKFDKKYQVIWGALCVFFEKHKRFPEVSDIGLVSPSPRNYRWKSNV